MLLARAYEVLEPVRILAQRFAFRLHCSPLPPLQPSPPGSDFAEWAGKDEEPCSFDDVAPSQMALAQAESAGLEACIGTSLNTALLGDIAPLKQWYSEG